MKLVIAGKIGSNSGEPSVIVRTFHVSDEVVRFMDILKEASAYEIVFNVL